MQIDPKLLEEWTESPVTKKLAEFVASELEEISGSRGINAYHPFEPQRTQEILANLNGCRETLEFWLAALDGDPSYFMDEEEDGDSEAVLE